MRMNITVSSIDTFKAQAHIACMHVCMLVHAISMQVNASEN